MATNIPLGFHIWSATLTVTGSTHNCTFTIAGKNNALITAASIEAAWRSSFTGAGTPLTAANIPAGWTLVETKATCNIGGVLQQSINTTPLVGAGASNPTPMNTALIVKKDTLFVGRPYQARLFAPPAILESNVDAAGNITSGLATIQGWWTTARNNVVTAGVDPVVLHAPALGLVPTAIQTLTVKSRLGTIGRRMRR